MDNMMIEVQGSASSDFPFLDLGDPADAWPAVLFHGEEVFEAVEIGIHIFSFLLSSLLTDGVGLVDVVNASDFQVMGAFVGRDGHCKEGQQGQQDYHQLHHLIQYLLYTINLIKLPRRVYRQINETKIFMHRKFINQFIDIVAYSCQGDVESQFRNYKMVIWRGVIVLCLVILTIADGYCGSSNCYQLLGVARDADEQTIRKAYRDLAKRYHPDKNQQQDTTALFQLINRAYETLTDPKSRFKYDLHIQNPEESDYYHEYRYYTHTYIQDPQIHPAIVVSVFLSLVSLLQYVMRKQMYERAILSITEGQDFRNKVNERCGKNKKLKEQIRDQMILDIEIQGGYSKPKWKDVLLVKLIKFPYSVAKWVGDQIRWVYKYKIRKQTYTAEDRQLLTRNSLKISMMQWQGISELDRVSLVVRELWIKQNRIRYQQQQRAKWLQQLKESNPNKYRQVMAYLKSR